MAVVNQTPDFRELSRKWAGRLVACRHPLLLAYALYAAWSMRSDSDWGLLSSGGRGLFSHSPLSVYANTPGLQAGPPSLVVMRGLDLLPGTSGQAVDHLLLAFLGWYLLFLVERWTAAGTTWRSAPLGAGLLTLAVGLPVLQQWAWLAGDTPHPEDALAIFTFVLAVRAIGARREVCGALLIGLAAAWKPWAVVALPMVWGCSHRVRALLIAVAVPAACWLPFIVGDHSTLSAVGHGLVLVKGSPLHFLGLSGAIVPDWWRTVELAGALAGAAVAARRDWRVAFAAGCALRLVLDPGGYDYYFAGLIMVTAVTERLVGARPWRTAAVWLAVGYMSHLGNQTFGTLFQLVGLGVLFLSWVLPWRHPLPDDGKSAVEARLVPAPRDPASERQPASLPPL